MNEPTERKQRQFPDVQKAAVARRHLGDKVANFGIGTNAINLRGTMRRFVWQDAFTLSLTRGPLSFATDEHR